MNLLEFIQSFLATASTAAGNASGEGQQQSFGLLFLAGVCFLLSGFFSGMEAGVLSLNRERLRHYLNQGRKEASILLDYLSQPADFLWTILAGNILFSFAALFALVVSLTGLARQSPWLFVIGFFICVMVYVILFDLLPKTLYQRFPNRLCMYSVGVFRFISLVLKPLVWVVSRFGNIWLTPTRESIFFDNFYESREQIKNVLKDSSQLFTREEDSLITNVINYGDKHVSRWMRPIESSIRVAPEDPVHVFVDKCRSSGLNRLPVIRIENGLHKAVGEIGLYPILFEGLEDSDAPVTQYMQEPLVFPSDFTVHQALAQLQKNARRVAIVVGREQEALGLVTLNGVLAILFGEVDI
jgi:CBS domain containing-hemolysin-like protein